MAHTIFKQKNLNRFLIFAFLSPFGIALSQINHTTIASYNVENLFDTINNPTTKDRVFTPRGKNRWSGEHYRAKIENIGAVINGIAKESGDFPAIITLCEVENRSVVEDLVQSSGFCGVEHGVIHYDSPDERGCDVAIIYRPSLFEVKGSRNILSASNTSTRDILTVWGKLLGEDIFIIALHLPSRMGGVEKSQHLRDASARQIRGVIDSLQTREPLTNIIVMGDFNDNATDNSIVNIIRAKASRERLKEGEMFNPFNELEKLGYGTTAYKDEWCMYDNIIVSQGLLNNNGLHLLNSQVDTTLYGTVYRPDYLISSQGRFRGYPLRAISNGRFQGGYSDHLPIYIQVSSPKK
ncbi:MAG: endonuclease/exonuclease/phosphatase family protein [Rikenellaceae bacterium]